MNMNMFKKALAEVSSLVYVICYTILYSGHKTIHFERIWWKLFEKQSKIPNKTNRRFYQLCVCFCRRRERL